MKESVVQTLNLEAVAPAAYVLIILQRLANVASVGISRNCCYRWVGLCTVLARFNNRYNPLSLASVEDVRVAYNRIFMFGNSIHAFWLRSKECFKIGWRMQAIETILRYSLPPVLLEPEQPSHHARSLCYLYQFLDPSILASLCYWELSHVLICWL